MNDLTLTSDADWNALLYDIKTVLSPGEVPKNIWITIIEKVLLDSDTPLYILTELCWELSKYPNLIIVGEY